MLDVGVGSYLSYLKSYTLVHEFSIQIVSLDFFLDFTGEELDWVRVGEVN